MKIENKATTRSYDIPDAGIKVIVGMHASLQNATYVVMPFQLMPDFVLTGKIILNLVQDGFTHHFANSLMTRKIPYQYQKRPPRRKILSCLLPDKH